VTTKLQSLRQINAVELDAYTTMNFLLAKTIMHSSISATVKLNVFRAPEKRKSKRYQ